MQHLHRGTVKDANGMPANWRSKTIQAVYISYQLHVTCTPMRDQRSPRELGGIDQRGGEYDTD